MLDIDVRNVGEWKEVKVSCDGISIDLGLLSDEESYQLAKELIWTASELDDSIINGIWESIKNELEEESGMLSNEMALIIDNHFEKLLG